MRKNKFSIFLVTTFLLFTFACRDGSNVLLITSNSFTNWEDSTIYKEIGIWHNECLTNLIPFFENISNDSLSILVEDGIWLNSYVFVPILNFVKNIYDLNNMVLDTTGLCDFFFSNKRIYFSDAFSTAFFINFIDSLVCAKQASQFYSKSFYEIISKINEENFDKLLYNYLDSIQQCESLTSEEKNYVRAIVGLAIASREFWLSYNFLQKTTKSPARIQLAPWAGIALCDIVIGAASVICDLISGEENAWKIAGRAAISAAAGSLCCWIGYRIGQVKKP